MRRFSFFLALLLRRHEMVPGETEYLGFEAFTRPPETNDTAASSPSDRSVSKTYPADTELPKAA